DGHVIPPLTRYPASKFRIEGRPAVQNIDTSWKTVSVDVVSTDEADRKPELLVAHARRHVDAARKRQVGRTESESILVDCQALRTERVRASTTVDRQQRSVGRRASHILKRSGSDDRRQDRNRRVTGTVRADIGRGDEVAQRSGRLLILRIDGKHAG